MRSRNLKPGYFTNEHLAECQPLARILFAGLWCVADREGRLEDRPRRIKSALLPYDDCDVDALLAELAERRFIARYSVDRCRYIAITNFHKHQHPHIKEPASVLPAPDKHQTSTEPTPVEPGGFPITDSLLLIPDSLIQGDGDARVRARATAPPADELVSLTSQIIAEAAFVSDELDDVERQVARSFELVPSFAVDAGPREAELFGRWKRYVHQPPADWYRAWLLWIKRAAEQQPRTPAGETFADKVVRWQEGQFTP